jgi:hypothetical protein
MTLTKNTLGNSPLQNEDRIIIERKGVPSETSLLKFRQYANGLIPSTKSISTNAEIDLSNAVLFDFTLTANGTITLVNATAGVYVFIIRQDNVGSRTITWPSNVKWADASAPTLTTTANAWDIITLIFDGIYFSAAPTLNFIV